MYAVSKLNCCHLSIYKSFNLCINSIKDLIGIIKKIFFALYNFKSD